ncbi:ribonuclease H-like protein [Apiospora marii]|uniref:Ribonuclease H-like protein n=1 Tax=Apiospora marii TaxID=335849 RepID=A0ABR1RYY8_9PEZI
MANQSIAFVAASKDKRQIRRRLGRRVNVKPARIFVPQHPGETPEHHFPQQAVYRLQNPGPRFVNRYDSKEILMVVGGSVLKTDRGDANGGCSFVYKGGAAHMLGHYQVSGPPAKATTTFPYMNDGSCRDVGGIIAFRLEDKGPGGEAADPTSNRAKMRAVIAALEFRAWADEGWRSIVIATDLLYVVRGATEWLPPLEEERQQQARRQPRPLEEMQGIIDRLRESGTEVAFWYIRPRALALKGSGLAHDALEAARKAAYREPDICTEEFTRFCEIDLDIW